MKLKQSKTIEIIEGVVFIIIVGFMFLTMFYADLTVTIQFALTYVDSLFDGQVASFYNKALESGIAPEGAVYDVGIYFLLGIWGIPIWILKKCFGVSILSIGSLLWFKLLLVCLFVKCGDILGKIAEELGLEKKMANKMWMLSFFTIFPILVAAQYDIIPILFMMNAILYILRGNWKWGVTNFAISFTMKPLAILSFLIILLVKEKKFLTIAKYGIISILPLLLIKIIYIFNPTNIASNNIFLTSMLQKLLSVKIEVGNGSVSVFFLLYFIICVFAYMYAPQNDLINDGKYMIWLLYVAWMVFLIFTDAYPYWIIYMAPFLILVILMESATNDFVYVMDSIINVSMIIVLSFKYSWVYGGEQTFSYLVLKSWCSNKEKLSSIGGIWSSLHMDIFFPAIYAILFGALLVVAYWGYACMKGEKIGVLLKGAKKVNWWLRIMFLYIWCGIQMTLLILSK